MVNTFKIPRPQYMLYFCILTTKYTIQYKQSCTTTTMPVERKVTMSHKYKVCYCTKRLSAVDIVPWGGKKRQGYSSGSAGTEK